MLLSNHEVFCLLIVILSSGKTKAVSFPVLDTLKAPIVAELETSQMRNYIDKVVDATIYNVTQVMLEQIQRKVDKSLNDALDKVHTELNKMNVKLTTEPRECMDINFSQNGIFTISPNGKDRVKVYCIRDGDKKWTVIQRRMDGSVNFDKTWSEYKIGFGSVTGEYWLGNDNIHLISSNGHHEISFYLEASKHIFGYANYSTFSVGGEQSKYILEISGYSGSTGDGMNSNFKGYGLNGQRFTTADQDNDSYEGGNCASYQIANGGWWHNSCFDANINCKYSGIVWRPFSNHLLKTIMMIRRTL